MSFTGSESAMHQYGDAEIDNIQHNRNIVFIKTYIILLL